MNAAPGGELRAAGGLWGPPARALREMLGRRFPKRHRPTWLSPGADQENPVLIRLLAAGWLTFRVAAPRLSPATTWGPSPANLVVANRPRGLTRDSRDPGGRQTAPSSPGRVCPRCHRGAAAATGPAAPPSLGPPQRPWAWPAQPSWAGIQASWQHPAGSSWPGEVLLSTWNCVLRPPAAACGAVFVLCTSQYLYFVKVLCVSICTFVLVKQVNWVPAAPKRLDLADPAPTQ